VLEITNLPEFNNQLDAWMTKAEVMADEVLRGVVSVAFRHIVQTGPQYSGDFVANTRIGVGAADTTFNEYAVFIKGSPFGEGSRPAINYATANAKAKLPEVSLKNKIFISTTVRHHGDNYAHKVEDGKVKFRPVNTSADRQGGKIYKTTEVILNNSYGWESGGILSPNSVIRRKL
jgi:hypothetical protein